MVDMFWFSRGMMQCGSQAAAPERTGPGLACAAGGVYVTRLRRQWRDLAIDTVGTTGPRPATARFNSIRFDSDWLSDVLKRLQAPTTHVYSRLLIVYSSTDSGSSARLSASMMSSAS